MTAVATRLVEFVHALREKRIKIGTAETIDAAQIVELVGLADRGVLREGLAAAMLRSAEQRIVFDEVFDLFFPAGVGAPTPAEHLAKRLVTAEDVREALAEAMAARDEPAMAALARHSVDMFGRVDATGGWSAHQALEAISPQTLVAAGAGAAGSLGQGFGQGASRGEMRSQVTKFRHMVRSEARRRSAEVRGRDVVARHGAAQTTGSVDFLSANREQLELLRKQVQPLARRLATRLSLRRRQLRHGQIDMRRTLRRAMGTGGVPVSLVNAKPKITKPDLVLLCDVSGSVAGFSDFTMHLVQALRAQFRKVRVFAFVNVTDEVTALVDMRSDLAEKIRQKATVTSWHGSSDYGEAFATFHEKYFDAVTSRSTVLILGDARNNNQDPQFELVRKISRQARAVYWLNPEQTSRWQMGDSEAVGYGRIVTMHECRNADQLTDFMTKVVPLR